MLTLMQNRSWRVLTPNHVFVGPLGVRELCKINVHWQLSLWLPVSFPFYTPQKSMPLLCYLILRLNLAIYFTTIDMCLQLCLHLSVTPLLTKRTKVKISCIISICPCPSASNKVDGLIAPWSNSVQQNLSWRTKWYTPPSALGPERD